MHMDDWKRLISRGNRCFERGDMASACAVYQDALFIAERRLPSWPDADAAIAAFVVSHHNLADLYARLDCLEDAAYHLQAAHVHVMQVLSDDGVRPELRQAALRHSQHTRAERLVFVSRHSGRVAPLRGAGACSDSAWPPSSMH